MQDLNATIFFKAKFHIYATSGENDDLLWKLILDIRSWITKKLNRPGCHPVIESSLHKWTFFKKGGKFYDLEPLNRVYAESVFHQAEDEPSKISWACKIVEKPEVESGYAPREWITEIGYQADTNTSAEISYVVTFSDQAGFIGFCQPVPQASIPNVIKALLRDTKIKCSIGPNQLSYDPIKLKPGDFPTFEKVLFNPDREVPVIYLSPQSSDEEHKCLRLLVDPQKLAENVTANALVYYSDSLDFTREMNYFGNSNYLCSGGAIRVYRPHIDVSDDSDPRHHRFIAAHFIEEHGEEKIIDILRRALAQDVHFYESLFRVDDCRFLIENDHRKAKITQIKSQSQGEIRAAEELIDEAAAEREESERKVLKLLDENNQLKSEIHSFKVRVEMLKEQSEKYRELETATQGVRGIAVYPNTPQAIAKYFETVYPDRIVFTERAYRSMDECTTKSDVLWEAFYHIAVDLYNLLKRNPATAFTDFKDYTGWDCSRGEGAQTHADSKFMRQRIDKYNGQEIDIEPHVKNGSQESDPKFVRIHFAYDPNVADKIIVGHCGKHLDNYSTRKARK